MHKTFYIDVDEEVTSVIDRLKKSSVKENILVVPQRALILQSIVNMKLLRKEVERIKKQVMVVTQDQHGQALAEKAGILVQASMEGIEEDDAVREDFQPKINDTGTKERIVENMEKKEKLKSLGSSDFFDIAPRKKIIRTTEDEIRKIKRNKKVSTISNETEYSFANEGGKSRGELSIGGASDGLDPKKEKELERIFGEQKSNNEEFSNREMKRLMHEEQATGSSEQKVSGKMGKFIFSLGIVCILSIVLVGAYLFFPQTDVDIYPQTIVSKNDLEIVGIPGEEARVDGQKIVIPSRLVEAEAAVTLPFDTTGKKNISDQKAHGSVTIYNEFSADSQPLVATTRLLTEDGRLFRLVAGVVVPGVSEIDGEKKPGVVEAEVVADQPGEEYNIDANKFFIPGLEGSSKYDKIYARSTVKMVGGGSSDLELRAVSVRDIELAKQKTKESAHNQVLEKIKTKLTEGEIVLESSTSEEFSGTLASPGEGMVADSFNYQVELKAKAIIVSQNQIDSLVQEYFSKKVDPDMIVAQTKIEYGNVDADFEKNSLAIRFHAEALFQSKINLDEIRSMALGKSTSQLKEVVDGNKQIKKIELSFYPDFLGGRIPSQGKWVNVRLIEPVLE